MRKNSSAVAGHRGHRPPIVAYMVAHGGKTLFWSTSDLYFTFYMNEVCGIAPVLTGLVVGISVLIAALADEMIGRFLADRVTTAREASRAQLVGGAASAVALVLFASVAFAPVAMRVPASIATLLLFRLTYAAIDVPQNALLTLATGSESDRTTLVAGRNVVGGIARVALSFLFVPIMAVQPPAAAATRFFALAVAMAIAVIISASILARVLGSQTPVPVPVPAARLADRNVISFRLARWMFVASLGTTCFLQLEPYLVAYGMTSRAAGVALMTAVAAGSVLSQPLWRMRALRVPGRLWPEALFCLIIAAVTFPLLLPHGQLGSTVAGLLYGAASGGLMFSLWTIFAGAAAGPDALAAYGRFSAAAKCGQGLATIGIGVVLQALRDSTLFGSGPVIAWVMAIVLILTVILLASLPGSLRKTVDKAVTT